MVVTGNFVSPVWMDNDFKGPLIYDLCSKHEKFLQVNWMVISLFKVPSWVRIEPKRFQKFNMELQVFPCFK